MSQLQPGSEFPLSTLDLNILHMLQRNGRMPFAEIASALLVDKGTISRHVVTLMRDKVIQNFHVAIDQRRIGLKDTYFVLAQLTENNLEAVYKFESALIGIANVVESAIVSGREHDFLLRIVARDRPHYAEILERVSALPKVKSLTTIGVLNRHRVEQLPLPRSKDDFSAT